MIRLKPTIDLSFGADIWRMVIDEQTDTLCLETRNNALKQVSFNAFSLVTGIVHLKGFTLPERWLAGIEAAFGGILFLHGYAAGSTPAHKGIIAVDIAAGEIIWANYNDIFDHLTINGPVVTDSRMMLPKPYLADINTGAKQRLYIPSTDFPISSNIVYPDTLSANDVPFDLLPEQPLSNIVHFSSRNNYRIVSLHAQKATGMMQLLYLWDDTRMVYEDILNSSIQKLQPEAFILYKNHLIYLKNRTEIKVINL